MKNIYKIISFVLVLVLLLSTVCSVSAFSPYQFGVNQKYKDLFFYANGLEADDPYYRYNYICEYNEDGSATSDEATPDYIFGHFAFEVVSYAGWTEAIGDYVVTVPNLYSIPIGGDTNKPSHLGLYIYSTRDCTLYTLRDAWECKLPRVEEVLDLISDRRIGDVNYDSEVNVKDVTLIQKHLADLDTIQNDYIGYLAYYEGSPRYVSDFNRDGERNVKDATAIQKYIAGLE